MTNSQEEIKRAVASGYWTLYRYNPLLSEEGKNPLILDSKEPDGTYQDFIKSEIRYTTLQKQFPEIAKKLFVENEAEALQKYQTYKKLAE